MYLEFYQLERPPFENTADARFFYASEQHREAVAAIEYTVRMRKGIVLVTGEIGAGKTTVTRVLSERCAAFAHLVQVMHSPGSPNAMLRQILRSLNVRHHRDDDHPRLLQRLMEVLASLAESDRPVVLIVDEAQTLNDETLEELRLLGNIEADARKMIQIILVGQSELRRRIRSAKFEALRQRIVIAKQLLPLTLQATQKYIEHRLAVASLDPGKVKPRFAAAAVHAIFQATNGVPRLINSVCDNCLLLGYVRQAEEITAAMARTVIADMVPSFDAMLTPGSQDDRPTLSLTGT